MTPPLGHLRVVEVCDLRGAMCGRLLADLGADVLKVLSPALSREESESTAFRYRNANKRGVTLDFHDATGMARFDGLLAHADIVIENLGRPDRRGHGLELDVVERRHPHLIHVSLSDFGLTGPRAGWRLEPLTGLAASGTLWATGFRDRPPCWLPGYLAHDCASVYGAIGALAAVLDRKRTGKGQLVEISVQEAALAGTWPWSIAFEDYLRVNPHLDARGTRNADGAYWVLPAKDGWVRTVIGTPRQWEGFVTLCGRPEALTQPEWANPGFRLRNVDVVRLLAETCLTDRTREELFAEALTLGTTVGVLHTPSEFVRHEQTRVRKFFLSTGFDGLADAPFAQSPYRLSATPTAVRRAAPVVGADDGGFALPPPATVRDGRDGLLLAGMKVVEFGMAAVVPEMCGVLSELGADVVKIESVIHPDVLRTSGSGALNRNFTFNAESRGRRSVAIDLSGEAGRTLALDLCARADVVAENYRGGVLDRLGLGYDAVRAVNPSVIYASSHGYGRGGPYGEMPAFGPLNAGFAGLHHLWSDPTTPYPAGTSLNHPDHIAGKLLSIAVLAAIEHRQRTGRGQHIDMAQTEAAAVLIGEVYLDAAITGIEPGARGNVNDAAVPHGVYRSQGDDAWIAIAVPTDEAWRALADALGWAPDQRFATLAGRRERRTEIDARLEEWTAARSAADAAAYLQDRGVSAMPVMGPVDHHADPHLAARRFIVTLQHPEVGTERHVGNPIRMSQLEQRTAASAPCLGAHTAEVLRDWLGYDSAAADALAASDTCR